MPKFAINALLCCAILINCVWCKPGGDYGTLGDYGAVEIGNAYQTLPDPPAVITNADLKPASTYEIGYGGPIAEPIVPAVFPLRSFGGGWGGWKQPIPQPIIAQPIPVITKPVPIPVFQPFGWGWQSPGIF